MSTIVCQGLQSCLEPRLIEPLVFKHILAPPKPKPQKENENEERNDNENFSCWSFIQPLANPQTSPEKVYVHPVAKQSSNTLSKQSLDMCTESLGSETGTHEFSSLSLTRERDQSIHMSTPREFTKKLLRSHSFPPPLSSSHSVQVRPHRENGRLVIKAITKAFRENYFQTERENGRLKLSLLKDKLYTDDEIDGEVSGKWVEGIEEYSGNFGGEIEKWTDICEDEENNKNGISSWEPFLVAAS